MKSSYKLFTLKGIEVRLHITLLILFVFPLTELVGYDSIGEGVFHFTYTSLFLLVLFSSVLVHELSHSLVAKRNRIKVRQITLWPLGGIASLGMIKNPIKELKVSVSGPLASLAIGFFLLFVLVAITGPEAVGRAVISGDVLEQPSVFNFTVLVAYLNLVLGAFNLFLPIFPMDGGRVLRSMLAMVTNRIRATRLAVRIGQGFLAVFIFFAIMAGSLWLVLIGIFLFIAGLSELRLAELDNMLKDVDLKSIIRRDFVAVSPELDTRDLLKIRVPGQTLYPVLESSGKPLGFVRLGKLRRGIGKIRDIMETRFPSIKLGEKGSEQLAKVYIEGYAFVLDKRGILYGILTLDDLQKAVGQ